MEIEVVHTGSLGATQRDRIVRRHIENWIANPVPGSTFDKKTRLLRLLLPISWIVSILFAIGYEGLVFLNTDHKIIGHVFFQKHGDAYHVFHWYIEEDERGQQFMHRITDTFFQYAFDDPSIARVRIGAGGDERITRLWNAIRDGNIVPSCGLRAGDAVGWLIFPARNAHVA